MTSFDEYWLLAVVTDELLAHDSSNFNMFEHFALCTKSPNLRVSTHSTLCTISTRMRLCRWTTRCPSQLESARLTRRHALR